MIASRRVRSNQAESTFALTQSAEIHGLRKNVHFFFLRDLVFFRFNFFLFLVSGDWAFRVAVLYRFAVRRGPLNQSKHLRPLSRTSRLSAGRIESRSSSWLEMRQQRDRTTVFFCRWSVLFGDGISLVLFNSLFCCVLCLLLSNLGMERRQGVLMESFGERTSRRS